MNIIKNPFARVLIYVLRVLIVCTIVVLLCVFGYRQAKQMSAIYIVTSEGMMERSEVILQEGNPEKYDEQPMLAYFYPSFLLDDPVIQKGEYQNYIVSTYDYSVKIDGVYVTPWSKQGRVRVSEIVSLIDGKLNDINEELGAALIDKPPQWDSRQYDVILEKDSNGRWFIAQLVDLGKSKYAQEPVIGEAKE